MVIEYDGTRGYVAVDSVAGAVKLVDRLEFSRDKTLQCQKDYD